MSYPRRGAGLFGWCAVVLVALGSVACGGEDGRAPVAGGSSELGWEPQSAELACEVGAVRECSVVLKERNGIVTCAPGFQICEESGWGDCDTGAVSGSGGEAGAPSADK